MSATHIFLIVMFLLVIAGLAIERKMRRDRQRQNYVKSYDSSGGYNPPASRKPLPPARPSPYSERRSVAPDTDVRRDQSSSPDLLLPAIIYSSMDSSPVSSDCGSSFDSGGGSDGGGGCD